MKKIIGKNNVLISLFLVLILSFFAQSYAQENGSFVKPEVSYGAMNLRNPFQSPVLSKSETNVLEENPGTQDVLPIALTVQGIIWGSDLPQAIINNKVVKVGETIDEAKVISIEKDSITVFVVNKQFKLLSPALTPLAEKSSSTGENSKYSYQRSEGKKEDVHER